MLYCISFTDPPHVFSILARDLRSNGRLRPVLRLHPSRGKVGHEAARCLRLDRLDQVADVALEVRDITGKVVNQIVRGTQPAGYHSITLDVANMASGVYTYTLNVNDARSTQRLIIK